MTNVYSPVAIVLHWILAITILSMVFMGWYMEDLREELLSGGSVTIAEVQSLYNLHKTVGLTILALSLLRLVWRLTHPVPGLPQAMKPWEKQVATGTHWLFYALMIGLPIGGWMASSASPFPSYFFNNPELAIPRLPVPQDSGFEDAMGSAHGAGAWAVLVLTALHVGAALKHQFIDRDNLLARMLPFLKG